MSEWCNFTIHVHIPYLIKDVLEPGLGKGRTLNVFDSAELLGHALAVLLLYNLHPLPLEFLDNILIGTQIDLSANNQAGDAGAVVVDLGEPLLADVLKRGGRCDGEADEKDIGLGVRKRTQTVVILLSSGIEKSKRVRLITNPAACVSLLSSVRTSGRVLHDSHGVVVKNSRDIF